MNLSEIEQPILSICIPTYNRAEYLRGALENITSDPEFDNRVEVVISDNASPDNTQEVGMDYANRFPNIKYFRNETNVRDENFKLAFQRASGKYLKLFNDTLRLNPGSLKKILEILSQEKSKMPLFVQTIDFLDCNNCTIHSKEELLQSMSFYITWIANFGVYREDLKYLDVPEVYTKLLFAQVAWLLNISNHKEIKIYYDKWYTALWPKNKGGYNIFKVFTDNYFSILKSFDISKKRLDVEKKNIFYHYFMLFIPILLSGKKINNFDMKGSWSVLFKHYKWEIYFYKCIIRAVLYNRSKLREEYLP